MDQIILKSLLNLFGVCPADWNHESGIGNKIGSVQFFYMVKIDHKTAMALMKLRIDLKPQLIEVFIDTNGFFGQINQAIALDSFHCDNVF